MAEQNRDNHNRVNTKQTKKFLVLIVVIVVIASTVLFSLIFWSIKQDKTVDEQLADIEAARAIPEAENAATIYNELLADPNADSLFDIMPDFLDDQTWNQTMTEPWLSKDHPKLAALIKEHQYVIDKLLEAGSFEECRYPIDIDIMQQSQLMMDMIPDMRQWAFLLSFAANNNLAEGQINAAITKWRCILQMGNHLRQQPMLIYHLAAQAIDRIAFVPMARFIVEENAVEIYLKKIEAIPLPVTNNWKKIFEETRLVEGMTTQKMKEQFSLFGQVQYDIISWKMRGIMKGPDLNNINELYLKHITTARGIHILIALRRYKNENDHWPESLDSIKSAAPAEAFIDPVTSNPLQYENHGESFSLYGETANIWPK